MVMIAKKKTLKAFVFLLLLASDSEFCLCSSEKQCLCGGARVLILMMMMMMMVEHKKKKVVKSETLDPESERSKITLQSCSAAIILKTH